MILRPSSASRWLRCPAAPSLSRAYPEESGLAAEEGTAAHWAASEMLYRRPVAEGQITPQGMVLSEEMIESAQVYVDDVQSVSALTQCPPHVEAHVHATRIHEAIQGTSDAFLVDRRARMLYVWDFKHGHRPVHVFENPQLVCYAAGAMARNPDIGPGWCFSFSIVQPRSYSPQGPIKRWGGRIEDLEPLFDRLALAAEDATSGVPSCHPTPECEYCPARHECVALQADAYRSAEISAAAITHALPPEALGLELRWLKAARDRLDARVTGLEAELTARLYGGEGVPGWMVTDVQGRETWTQPPESVIAMGDMSRVNLRAKPRALTPKQAREAGVPENIVAMFATRPTTRKVVADDGSLARRVFGKDRE